jgi:hypothetical protein
MADLNKMLGEIQKESTDLKKDLQELFSSYDSLFRESNHSLQEERLAANGKMAGIEEFYIMVQSIRRNRDIIGSMLRGINGLRPLSVFKVIEEDVIPKSNTKRKPKSAPSEIIVPPEEIIGTDEVL